MNEEAKKRLEELCAKEPQELNDDQKRFIFARRTYLSGDQKEKFAKVMEEVEEANLSKDKKAEEVEEEPKAKKDKKDK